MKLKGYFVLFCVLAVLTFVGIGLWHTHQQVCEKVVITIQNPSNDTILTEKQVADLLSPLHLEGTSFKQIHRSEIERQLRQNVWIDSLVNLSNRGSSLVVTVKVKEPFLAIFPVSGDPYYIDATGGFLPNHPNIKSQRMVVNGRVTTGYSKGCKIQSLKNKTLFEAYTIIQHLQEFPHLADQFSQLFVTDKGEFELYNSLGQHIVVLGHSDNMSHKLQQLSQVYDYALVHLGMNTYKTLDVRYKNRVFGIKK